MKLWGVAVACLALAGCATSLETQPVGTHTGATVGPAYRVPALRYTLKTTRILADCEVAGAGGGQSQLKTTFDVKTVATAEYIAGEEFIADYRPLSNWATTSTFKMQLYPNRTLKSFNATATDKGPEIATELVKTGFNVARIFAPLSAAGAGLAEVPTCPTALNDAKAEAKQIKALTAEIEARTAQLEPYVTAAAAGGLTPRKRAELARIREEIAERETKLTALRTSLAAHQKTLTFEDERLFTPTASAAAQAWPFPLPPEDRGADAEAQTKWLKGLFTVVDKPLRDQLRPELSITARYAADERLLDANICDTLRVAAGCAEHGKPVHRYARRGFGQKVVPGLVYRDPVLGGVKVCRGEDPKACEADANPLVASRNAAPQMGRLMVLPFRNGFGEDNALLAQFREDGSPELVSFEHKAAPGVAVAKLLNTFTAEKIAYDQQLEAKHEAEAKAAKAAADAAKAAPGQALDAQIGLLKKEKELRELQAGADPAVLDRDRGLADLNAQIAQLQARKTIKELEAQLAKP